MRRIDDPWTTLDTRDLCWAAALVCAIIMALVGIVWTCLMCAGFTEVGGRAADIAGKIGGLAGMGGVVFVVIGVVSHVIHLLGQGGGDA